jgi:hypothetical protein
MRKWGKEGQEGGMDVQGEVEKNDGSTCIFSAARTVMLIRMMHVVTSNG